MSEVQNARNRDLNAREKCSLAINVVDGSFEEISMPDDSVDVVWSQDAILHSDNRRQVFEEVSRVLSKGGQFIFTDPMQRDDCPVEVLQPILDRIHLDSLGSIPRYREMLSDLGFEELDVVDLTPNLTTHYARVLDEVRANQWDLLKVCGAEYIERMQTGLQHWVDGGRAGHLQWGILHFRKV